MCCMLQDEILWHLLLVHTNRSLCWVTRGNALFTLSSIYFSLILPIVIGFNGEQWSSHQCGSRECTVCRQLKSNTKCDLLISSLHSILAIPSNVKDKFSSTSLPHALGKSLLFYYFLLSPTFQLPTKVKLF